MKQASILLIEDDEFLQSLYQELLKDEGYHVTVSGDGNKGLETILSQDWDLILLDVMLPGIDGFQIFQSVAEKDKKKVKKIVFLTNLEGNDADKAKLEKAKKYLIKSDMSPPEFVEKVKSLL